METTKYRMSLAFVLDNPSPPTASQPNASSPFTRGNPGGVSLENNALRLAVQPHSNEPFTKEQVLWMIYQRRDCSMRFKAISQAWARKWPGRPIPEGSQAFSARIYRDNGSTIPALNSEGRVLYDHNNQPIWMISLERTKYEAIFSDIPCTLVEKYPHLALKYSWVKDEHKEIARLILSGKDTDSRRNRQAGWRRVIKEVENYAYPKESNVDGNMWIRRGQSQPG